MYYIVGAVAAVYLIITIANRRRAKARKSRTFMGGYTRRDKEKKD